MSKKKLLVVGTRFGQTYLEAAKQNPNWKIAGIVAKTNESLEKVGEKYDIDKNTRFTDLNKALIECEADAVVIAVPNWLHYEFAKKVIEADKHLIIEKPITETWEQAVDLVKMLDARKDKNLKAMVGQTLRGDVMLRLMALKLKEGIIGEIEHLSFESHHYWVDDPKKSWRFKLPQMYLEDIGIHQFDLIRMLLGNRKPISIIGKTFKPKSYPLPIQATASGIITFEDNIHVNYFASMGTKGKAIGWFGRIEVFGTKGSMVKEAWDQPYVYLASDPNPNKSGNNIGESFGLDDKFGDEIDELLPNIEYEKIAFLLQDFYEAITEDRPPITDLHDNLNSHAILIGMKKSNDEKREIDVKKELIY